MLNDFFYKNIAVSVTSQLNLIHLYEWNKITITMTATSAGGTETIYFFTNYNYANYITIPNSASGSQKLDSIAFCGQKRLENLYCKPGGIIRDIQWGSAYYSNIRIWKNIQFLKSPPIIAQEYVSQSFNLL